VPHTEQVNQSAAASEQGPARAKGLATVRGSALALALASAQDPALASEEAPERQSQHQAESILLSLARSGWRHTQSEKPPVRRRVRSFHTAA